MNSKLNNSLWFRGIILEEYTIQPSIDHDNLRICTSKIKSIQRRKIHEIISQERYVISLACSGRDMSYEHEVQNTRLDIKIIWGSNIWNWNQWTQGYTIPPIGNFTHPVHLTFYFYLSILALLQQTKNWYWTPMQLMFLFIKRGGGHHEEPNDKPTAFGVYASTCLPESGLNVWYMFAAQIGRFLGPTWAHLGRNRATVTSVIYIGAIFGAVNTCVNSRAESCKIGYAICGLKGLRNRYCR